MGRDIALTAALGVLIGLQVRMLQELRMISHAAAVTMCATLIQMQTDDDGLREFGCIKPRPSGERG